MKNFKIHTKTSISFAAFFSVLFTTLSLFCLSAYATAANTVNLREGTQRYALGLNLSYLEDKDGTLSLQNVMSDKLASAFIPNTSKVPNFKFTQSTYWFRFDLKNQDSPVSEWVLEIVYPFLDFIDVYIINKDQQIQHFQSGDKVPFSQRAIKHRYPMFKVALVQGEPTTIFLRIKTNGSFQVPLELWSRDALSEKDHNEQYLLGLYYGIIVAMFFYNLMLYLSIRDINYLYYLYYLSAWGFFQLSINGLAFEYLWPQATWWTNVSTPLLVALTFSGIIQFSRSFLQTKLLSLKLDRALQILFFALIFIAIGSFFAAYSLVLQAATFCAGIGTIIILVAATISLYRGLRQAKYFLISWAILFLGIFVFVLKTFGVLPNIFLTEYGLQIGSALEVILLSFALAHRMRILKEDNERIQLEAKETLEQRVQQRTLDLDHALKDLSEANAKLKESSQIDFLTGVKNRTSFNERLHLDWRRAFREQNFIGVLMIDIDHFKRVNDTHGHLMGDACIQQVAKAIKQSLCRPYDEVFRYGGEEFVAILPNTNLDGARILAQKICDLIRPLKITYEEKTISVTLSIGVASIIPEADTFNGEALVAAADAALYQAKHNGRDQVCLHSNSDKLLNRPAADNL